MSLPPELRSGLDAALPAGASSALAAAADRISHRYRAADTPGTVIRSDAEALAYLASRLPATYAAAHRVLTGVSHALPSWQPRSMLDVGAGPGTATWAAFTVWPEIRDALLVEADDRMITLGRALQERASNPALQKARWQPLNLEIEKAFERRDLIVASYVLGEIAPAHREALLDALWKATTGVLVIIQPGTPAGFDVVRTARASLIASGGYVSAPCPHDGRCPMAGGDWCHFSRRLPRNRVHRELKSAELGYEDEKYSYVAVARHPAPVRGSRVLRHPIVRPGQIQFELCTASGLRRETITRRDRARFKVARHTEWGDTLEPGTESAEPPTA